MTDKDNNTLTLDIRKTLAKAASAMQEEALTKSARGGERGGKVFKYADLNSVLSLVKRHLKAHNLVLTQPIAPVEGQERTQQITTMVTDTATGEYLMFSGPIFPVPNDPQASGSAITYNRRYALVTLFALEQEDDDGAQAHRAATRPNQRTEAEAKIRSVLEDLDADKRKTFVADFKADFGTSLSNLPESRHGEALTWVNEYLTLVTATTDT